MPAAITQQLVNLIRRHKLTYGAFNEHCKHARRICELKPDKTGNRLPQLPTDEQLQAAMDTVERYYRDKPTAIRNVVLLRMLYYSAGRVAEVVKLRLDAINWDTGEIFIAHGKGDKDRVVLFPESFKLVLRAHAAGLPAGELYLFPTAFRRPMSKRNAQDIVSRISRECKVYLHCHVFRHLALTEMTRAGMPTEKIMNISGHADPKTLKRYQHLAPAESREGYEKAMGRVKL